MSLLNKIIAIKLAGQPEGLVGLSDLRSNLSCLTIWVGRLLLSMVFKPAGRLGAFLDTKTLKKHPSGHPKTFWWRISSSVNLKYIINFFHLHIIPMTLYKKIMPHFDKFIHVVGWNLSVLWYPSKIWTPKGFSIANFRHPVWPVTVEPCKIFNIFILYHVEYRYHSLDVNV